MNQPTPEALALRLADAYAEASFDQGLNRRTLDAKPEECRKELDAELRRLTAENEALRGLKPELPQRPPHNNDASFQHHALPRFGLRWNGPGQPVSVPMADGYWTPFHLALAEVEALRSFKQAVTDPENQPSQHGTVTVEYMNQQVEALREVFVAAEKLLSEAEFRLGGVLSASSKRKDIPSNAYSQVKSRNLASLRDAIARSKT